MPELDPSQISSPWTLIHEGARKDMELNAQGEIINQLRQLNENLKKLNQNLERRHGAI